MKIRVYLEWNLEYLNVDKDDFLINPVNNSIEHPEKSDSELCEYLVSLGIPWNLSYFLTLCYLEAARMLEGV